jgi:hypothetical protein
MKINKILTEKLSHIVYVARSINGLHDLFEKNVLSFKRAFKGGEVEGNYYFLETYPTRASAKDLIKGRQTKITVLISLNGELINQKIKPSGTNRYIHDKNLKQSDKIYSDSSALTDAISLIEEISVLVPSGIQIPEEVHKAKNIAKSKNIPFFIFQNETDLVSNNRKNAIKDQGPEEPVSAFLADVRKAKT